MAEKIKSIAVDGNEAVAKIAYQFSEVIALYPITPSSSLGEFCDLWASQKKTNLWDDVPRIIEMQSEGGAAGAVHGALQTGALSTTFTASQGLLLMIPNMYKIAGELTPAVFHVTARTLATHALSIFGDHSDVMSIRQTGWAMLSSASVQEAGDMAAISHLATLKARIPFVHFYDGFRVSHEVAKIEPVSRDVLKEMIDEDAVAAHRQRALSPDDPKIRGTAQNPDVFFQMREAANLYYEACPDIVQNTMNEFAKHTGRQYKLFDYYGAADAEHVIVIMGSGAETVIETIDNLNDHGYKIGVVIVRLYRPFVMKAFCDALPKSVQRIAVLDRTKEPGGVGEPLYLDVVAAINEAREQGWIKLSPQLRIIGGRYGLSSKEFTPAMVKGIYDHLRQKDLKSRFTIGIYDDVTHTSLNYDHHFIVDRPEVKEALFYGLGSDGTVGANKNSIKIIAEETDNYAQGYFVYDSKKSGSMTISHMRFGPHAIRSPYLVDHAFFVACHQPIFLDKHDVLRNIKKGGIFLLNTSYGEDKIWDRLPEVYQRQIIEKELDFYVIDAYKVAKETGMDRRINTIMQVCFFAITNVIDKDQALGAIKNAIKKTYAKKGEAVINKNIAAVDQSLDNLKKVKVPSTVTSTKQLYPAMDPNAPEFSKQVLGMIAAGFGDDLPVSAFPVDGTFPSSTSMWEKRNLAREIPVWDEKICTQCGKCPLVCPHAAIRIKASEPAHLENPPSTYKFVDAKEKSFQGLKFTVQVSPEDCTGCKLCAKVCPAVDKKDKNYHALMMTPQEPLLAQEKENWEYFAKLPETDRSRIDPTSIRSQQAQQPLFEFSGACVGCGETPYVKLVSQMFGDRTVIANATGCSSIYGGNLPTTPWCRNDEGRGPAWANSLFEDNAEFGLGFRVSIDQQKRMAQNALLKLQGKIDPQLIAKIINAPQNTEEEINKARTYVAELKSILKNMNSKESNRLLSLADMLIRKSVWIIGGDGWAYDIGYGGLDHVLASGENVNILVLDTEVYSNTGGQCSKSTPIGAIAKFAEGGKHTAKKDMGTIAMAYRSVYVASVALGAKDRQTLKAFAEAESYDGPSIILAYSPCVAHGIEIADGLHHQEMAVDAGRWPLYRYDPRLEAEGKNPLQLDSKKPSMPLREFLMTETRFKALFTTNPKEAEMLLEMSEKDVIRNWERLAHMAGLKE